MSKSGSGSSLSYVEPRTAIVSKIRPTERFSLSYPYLEMPFTGPTHRVLLRKVRIFLLERIWFSVAFFILFFLNKLLWHTQIMRTLFSGLKAEINHHRDWIMSSFRNYGLDESRERINFDMMMSPPGFTRRQVIYSLWI